MSDQISIRNDPNKITRIFLVCTGAALLLAVYLLQQTDFLTVACGIVTVEDCSFSSNTVFIANKTFRMIVNDGACMLIISGVFKARKYLQVAFYVFLFELLILLPIYFTLKLTLEGNSEISSPLLSQIHRMIVNPTLLLILMIGFLYQQWINSQKQSDV